MMVFHCQAQIQSAKVGINGLTCSQCSRSVEMQLRKLAFVANVNMDLSNTEGTLQFKEGSKIDFSKIAQAVKDAGFSVRFLEVKIDMQKVKADETGFKIANDLYLFPNAKDIKPSVVTFRFLGKKYASEKEKIPAFKNAKTSGNGNVYYVKIAT